MVGVSEHAWGIFVYSVKWDGATVLIHAKARGTTLNLLSKKKIRLEFYLDINYEIYIKPY